MGEVDPVRGPPSSVEAPDRGCLDLLSDASTSPDAVRPTGSDRETMNARQIDEAGERLRDLRLRAAEELALGAGALGLSIAATQLWPSLAVPLLVGAVVVSFLGVQALVRRSFLIEDLAAERDAYVLPAVRRFGLRVVSPAHRRRLASTLRVALKGSTAETAERLEAVRPELDELIADLEDDSLRWDPAVAIGLEHWLTDSFRDPAVSVAEARTRLRSFLAGFDRRPAAGAPNPNT